MNIIKSVIESIKSKKNIKNLNDFIKEIYDEINDGEYDVPYMLVWDIVSRMINVTYNIKDIDDINFRDWDKKLKIDEINNKDIHIPKEHKKTFEHFMKLYNTPQPEQRTQEWFDYRYNRITASDTATAIDNNPYESVESFICKKCDPNFPFLDNDFVFHGKKYEQIATSLYEHIYNTKVTEFTPDQKYTFLENNIKMLLELRNKKCFLGDYKLANIGWDDNLNIILIDYDQDTIVRIDERLLRKHKFLSKIRTIAFAHTYKPKYIFPDDKNTNVNDTEIAKYDKFSIAGLINIIEKLHIKQDLIDLFKLKDTNYDNIFTYEKMLEVLPTLKPLL
jgi:hypothetical protein